ncbi:MAG: PAS domain S-box protein [Nitrospirae bacterium]|nr:PAS domain S-box protein [Nitrospirota bacterium]
MSIQKKVVSAILFSSLIFLTASLLVTYYHVKDVLINVTGSDFAEIAKKTAERFDSTLKEEITTFKYLASNKTFIKGVKENSRDSLDVYLTYYLSYMEEEKEHLGLFIVNDRGRIIAGDSHSTGYYNPDQSDEHWWKVTYSNGKGSVYVSNIYFDKIRGVRAFDIGIPVSDPANGRIVGGIRSVMNVDLFFDFIREMGFGKTGHGMLVDSNGTPLICALLPPAEHYFNNSLINLFKNKKNDRAIAHDDAHGGKNSIIGFSELPYTNSFGTESLGGRKWYTFVRQDPKETFAPLYQLMKKALFFDSLIVMLLTLLGLITARKMLLRPVNILHSGIDKVSGGDLSYKITIHTGDELESLAYGFNKMSDSLKESYDTLEAKISDRTIELEKTKNYLESILKYSTDMIITTDMDGKIVTFNEGAEKMLGYKSHEVIGTIMADYYFNKADREKVIGIIKSSEMIKNFETQLVRKDGGVIDISLSLSLLKDENGKVIGTVGISKNITGLKTAQNELKEYSQKLESMVEQRTIELEESKSHLEAMLSGIADGVIFTNQDNKLTFINDAAETIFDIKKDEWIGKDFQYAHSADSHKKAIQLIADMRAGKLTSYSGEIRSGNKTIFANFSPIMHGEEYLGVIFISRDITEMKRLQTNLVKSEKLALVGKMSSQIAHELRNPLVPIGGFARLISRRLEEDSPLKNYSNIIVKEIDRLEKLLHNILYFTKEIKPVTQPGDLNNILEEIIALYKDSFTDKFINTRKTLSSDIPLISIDSAQIKQAMINIMNNSIQAMPVGGTLTIESSIVDQDKIPFAQIKIKDTGSGIPEEIRKHIFDPFYTTKIQGMGLGLTLTKEIIEAHNGDIEVESKEGKGTTFIVRLPLS